MRKPCSLPPGSRPARAACGGGRRALSGQALKIIVPFPAGSGTDTGARVLGQWLTAKTGQPVIVDNRPGASGFIAAQAAAAAAPDGYTVLLTTNTTHAANPAMFKKLPYDPVKDFEPVSMVGSAGLLLLVPADSPHKDIGSFLAQLRAGGKRLRLRRRQLLQPHRRRAAQDGHRRRSAGSAVQGHAAGPDRPHGRADRLHVLRHRRGAAARDERQAARAGRLERRARAAAARRAHLAGSRLEGLRDDGVVRGLRSREDAEGHRREAERAAARRARRPGGAPGVLQHRRPQPRIDARRAARVREVGNGASGRPPSRLQESNRNEEHQPHRGQGGRPGRLRAGQPHRHLQRARDRPRDRRRDGARSAGRHDREVARREAARASAPGAMRLHDRRHRRVASARAVSKRWAPEPGAMCRQARSIRFA